MKSGICHFFKSFGKKVTDYQSEIVAKDYSFLHIMIDAR